MAALNVQLATLQQVKDALHIEHGDRDATLNLHIAGASSAIVAYLKTKADEFIVDGALVEADMPAEVRTATIMFVRLLLDGSTEKDVPEPISLPWQVRSLLYQLRTPTLA